MKAKRESKRPAPPASGNRAIEVRITSNAANTKSEPIPELCGKLRCVEISASFASCEGD